jgi:hypothetical protein
MTPCQNPLNLSSTGRRLPFGAAPSARGVAWGGGAVQAPDDGAQMSDKSPRQGMTKKSTKSIKEKRAEKRAKGTEESFSDKFDHKKK